MITRYVPLVVSSSLALAAALGVVAGQARADTSFIEAEQGTFLAEGFQTPPMLLKDQAAASGGSFIEVAAGNNSTASPPSTGIATYTVFGTPGPGYRIWARVMAPDRNSDSFYVRMNGGTWIRWNDIPLGNAWHWVRVIPDGSTQPAQFTLVEADNTLQIAYREDGARLDLMVLTNDPTFNPNTTPPGPPGAPPTRLAGGKGAVRINWTLVPGATSYKVLRLAPFEETEFTTIATGITNHTFTNTGLTAAVYCYDVVAVNAAGEGAPGGDCTQATRLFYEVSFADQLSVTPPMRLDPATGFVGAPAGTNSLTAPPATGRAVTYFQSPVSAKVKVWAAVSAPNANRDSFWVRMDAGTWVRWNDIVPNVACRNYAVVDQDGNPNTPVTFNLGGGSHTLEFAYREGGAGISRVVVQDDLVNPPPCSD